MLKVLENNYISNQFKVDKYLYTKPIFKMKKKMAGFLNPVRWHEGFGKGAHSLLYSILFRENFIDSDKL